MKTKLVLWGSNAQEERVLIALALKAELNKVVIYTFSEKDATEEFSQLMLKEWRNGQEVAFPEGHTMVEQELSMTESMLPDDLKVERSDLIQRAQTEWHFIVLSSKLNEAYQSELEEMKERINKLESYSSESWEKLKTFWDKVQMQVRDKNLFREHANSLRDNTNALFSKMKELRSKLDDEFQEMSKKNHDRLQDVLKDINERIDKGLRLQPIFEELKELQRKFRDTKLTKEHRSAVWERLDGTFKVVKTKRFGANAAEDKSPMERLNRRYNGLLAAIEKMERSIQRDRDDLVFQNKKIAATDGQLEAQIRQAKIKMIDERIRSKEEKLGEMHQTKQELERRISVQKEKDAKKGEKERLEEAKKEAEQKIQQEIKAAANAREEESEKFSKAAEAISKKPEEEGEEESTPNPPESAEVVTENITPAEPASEEVAEDTATAEEPASEEVVAEDTATAEEPVAETTTEEPTEEPETSLIEKITDAVEDAVDTAKAVATVIGDKIEDTIEDLKEQISTEASSEEEE